MLFIIYLLNIILAYRHETVSRRQMQRRSLLLVDHINDRNALRLRCAFVSVGIAERLDPV